MTEAGSIVVEPGDQGVVELTISRPAKLNAMTSAMYAQFSDAMLEISADEAVRCVILRGAGNRAFCAGSDIGEFSAAIGDSKALREASAVGRQAMDTLLACPHPIVAAIDGACFGGGLQIAAACDLRVASTDARFGIPIKALGIFAEAADLRVMTRALGMALSLELLLTGRTLTSSEAMRAGFISCVDDDPFEAARTMAEEIASGAPLAARWHKSALRCIADDASAVAALHAAGLAGFDTADFAEGCAAFLAKRTPRFIGA